MWPIFGSQIGNVGLTMPGSKAKSRWKSLIVLSGAAILLYGAVRTNAPVPKKLRFEVACERFPVVGDLALDFYQNVTELDSVIAYDFGGAATDVAQLSVPSAKNEKPKEKPRHISALTLEITPATNEPNAHINLQRRGAVGTLSMIVRMPAELTGGTTASSGLPWMTVESRRPGDAALTIEAAELVIKEANRYRFPEIGVNSSGAPFAALVQGNPLLKLVLESKGTPRTYASLIFKKSDAPLPVLRGTQPLPNNSRLTFYRSMNPTLLLDDHRIEGIPADQPVDIAADYSTATLENVAVIYDPERRRLPALMLAGSAVASSLRVEGRERIPTRLEEILDKPVADRSLWLLILGATAAFILKAVDHALGIILEWFIPKGDA